MLGKKNWARSRVNPTYWDWTSGFHKSPYWHRRLADHLRTFRHFAARMGRTRRKLLRQLLQYKYCTFLFMALEPGCAGVDFFEQNLTGENCLVVAPVTLITRALHYLHRQKALAPVVVLYWPSYFWPLIFKHLAHFIVYCKVFRDTEVLAHGRNTNALLGSDRFLGDKLALRMKFY